MSSVREIRASNRFPVEKLRMIFVYLLLIAGVGIMLFPFLWMVATSFKIPQDVYNLRLIPETITFDNYATIFKKAPFSEWIKNTLIISLIATTTVVIFDTATGYVLAKFSFIGKQLIFIIIISTIMVPTEMLIIPWYLIANEFGWSDTYWGVLFPGIITAFGIFLMRQFMDSIPSDLLDAARVDGLNEWSILLNIAIPLVKPAIVTLIILTFIGNWNQFIWPLIVLQTEEKFTLPVGIVYFSSELKDTSNWILIMAGTTISIAPLILIFLIFQKQIIRGIALSGMK
ncbi:carbohydrate ABC transporter membrane protein 2, CUT1 family [Fontibacillus panacisegetis]|uniref:Carbohydrate ABC transporter membrane protein 2, CUT1 family n=1 Tax=Fontibacillus panacisegetis TaxID=670482 RepID=A0A1G7QGT3_9BACL|nr:carbohydrate ABC transporter permease [Fontibacillus panacisegetis]SDF97169.1 carbohydrate ABC transporter membrane protein 2, CUT1 family [Fontibacillus panacisegetis]